MHFKKETCKNIRPTLDEYKSKGGAPIRGGRLIRIGFELYYGSENTHNQAFPLVDGGEFVPPHGHFIYEGDQLVCR